MSRAICRADQRPAKFQAADSSLCQMRRGAKDRVYSLPETDSFFRHLYALGSVGSSPLRRIAVFNPDTSGATKSRFEALLGPGAKARYEYYPMTFSDAIPHIQALFPKRR